jgi:2-polyprenyl-3-methyl-5-hydroxy-6-metoxy-1,4-benzoquinol methylase
MDNIEQPLSETTFQEYIFGSDTVDDRERLVVQHELFKPAFLTNLDKVFGEYGLQSRLEHAKQTGGKVRILDMGCGEGLYLYTLEEILAERGFGEVIQLIGVDKDAKAIDVANEMALEEDKVHVHFTVHDLTQPLYTNPELTEPFDFIYEIASAPYVANFQAVLKNLFENSLKPGGIMYFRDFTTNEQDTGWITFNPTLTPFFRAFIAFATVPNGGIDLSKQIPLYLAEISTAEKIYTATDVVPIDSKSEIGMNMLRNMVLLVHNSGPVLVRVGKLTQEVFDSTWETMLNEIDEDTATETGLVNTLVKKKD